MSEVDLVGDRTAADDAARPDGADVGDRLLNRELSWLDFNARVLDLCADDAVPLLERVRFCSIFAANLDEFFMVRVAGLLRQAASGVAVRSPDDRTPQAALTEIGARVRALVARQGGLWHEQLVPELAAAGIRVARVDELSDDERRELSARFEREVYPVLTPLAVGPGQPFPYISGLSVSLALWVRDPESGEERLARIKVPEGFPRFVSVGFGGALVPLEDVIAAHLQVLFPGMELLHRSLFRVTRDADFEVSDEADDLLEAVELELRRRRFGDVVRLEVSADIADAMLERLRVGLGVEPDQIVRVVGMLDLADLSQIAALDRPELKYEPWVPVTQPRLALREGRDLFAEIRRGDILVHHPYDSFATSVERFVGAVNRDEDVIGVKATVYRTNEESPIMPALIEAAHEGKQSVCLLELKARFDEQRNIEWSRALERAGVHVVYGFPNLKIHAKTILVVRREGDHLRRYVHVGTGNYHAVTARLYEDVGLLTADEEISADVADLFNYLTGFGRPQRFRRLLVAPFTLRSGLIEEIRRVAAAVRAGDEGRIRIKVNALTDPAVIEELYDASRAGVPIDLVVRGICALRPGVPGLSETIRVRSVLGRFLEHSRVYAFRVAGREQVYIGSADLMPRNLDHRIEIVTPILDERLSAELSAVLDVTVADNRTAWELAANGSWSRVEPEKGARPRPTQATLMRRSAMRARRRK